MHKVELKDLINQQKKIKGIINQSFENNKGEKVKKEIMEDWEEKKAEVEKYNKSYIFKNILIVFGGIMFSFFVSFLCGMQKKMGLGEYFALNLAISIVVLIFIFISEGFFTKENYEDFNDYFNLKYNQRMNSYSYNLILSKDDLKPIYETLTNYFSEEKLFNKMEEVKESEEQVGSYRFVYRLIEIAIKEEKILLNSSKILGKQVKAIINDQS